MEETKRGRAFALCSSFPLARLVLICSLLFLLLNRIQFLSYLRRGHQAVASQVRRPAVGSRGHGLLAEQGEALERARDDVAAEEKKRKKRKEGKKKEKREREEVFLGERGKKG